MDRLLREQPISRPSSAGASTSTASASTSSSSNTNDDIISRPSSFAARPHLGVQTRLRARSITSGSGSGTSTPVPSLSPTLVGSPVLAGSDSFSTRDDDQHASTSSSRTQQRQQRARASTLPSLLRRSTDPGQSSLSSLRKAKSRSKLRDFSDEEDETVASPLEMNDSEGDRNDVPKLYNNDHEASSTDSDELPRTPADNDYNHHQFQGKARSTASVPSWVIHSPDAEKATKSPTLEGSTRHDLRRGRSFTSLLVQPVTPSPAVIERPDPIAELYSQEIGDYSPPASDVESARGSFEGRPSLAALENISSLYSAKSIRDFIPQVLTLAALFVSSLAVIAFLVATLPGLFIPHSVADLPELTNALTTYRASSWTAEFHLFFVLTALFLWKQCFSIPGSILTNILFGALYGTSAGTFWACLWTALGSTGAYGIAVVIAPLVEYYFAKPLDVTRRALKLAPTALTGDRSDDDPTPITPLSAGDLFTHLLLARFFPLLPYSVLNVISGVLRLPLPTFFLTLVLGSFPFNFVTVSIGAVVSLAAADPSTPLSNKIWSSEVLTKLVLVTIVSVLPVVFKSGIKTAISSPALARFVNMTSKIPSILSYIWTIYKDALVRKLFGFGSLGNGSNSVTHGGQAQRGWKRQKKTREWRRTLARSAGYEQVSSANSLPEELELGGDWVPLGD